MLMTAKANDLKATFHWTWRGVLKAVRWFALLGVNVDEIVWRFMSILYPQMIWYCVTAWRNMFCLKKSWLRTTILYGIQRNPVVPFVLSTVRKAPETVSWCHYSWYILSHATTSHLRLMVLVLLVKALKRICCRCGATYSVSPTGKHIRKEECTYHYGKGITKKGKYTFLKHLWTYTTIAVWSLSIVNSSWWSGDSLQLLRGSHGDTWVSGI